MSDGPVTDYDIEQGVFPADLLARERWFCWAYDDGRKIPRAPWETGGDKWVSWKDKSVWTDFETASDWREKMDGYELASCIPPRESNAEERLILFDFDNCRDPATGAIHPHAWAFLIGDEREALHGALSTSGTGIHGYAWASIPTDLKPSWTHELCDWTEFDGYDESPFDEPPELECYAADRFIALTGDHIAETPTAVPELNETVHDMFLKFGTERVVGTAREPDVDREEVRDIDETGDIEVIFDAIAHVRPGDIRLRSAVTEERADGTVSLDPSWESSDSGTRLAELEDCWLYRKGNHRLDALQVVALEERIVTDPDEYPSGEGFWNAVEALRGRGAVIPVFQTMSDDQVVSSAEAAQADGGAVADSSGSGDGPPTPTLRERVKTNVLAPLDPPDDSDATQIDDETARDRLADLIEEEYSFLRPRSDTRGWRDTLYVYSEEDGIYEPHGEAFIDQEVERLVGAWSTNQRVREIVGKIERRSRVNKRELHADPERLVVANGILDLTTGELHDHDPEEYHQTMIDVAWNPDAECPAIDDFLHDVVEPKDVPKLYRLIAHCIYKEYAAEKAAMLLGDGRNGKSVFLSVVERFLGNWNVSNQSLQELNEDEWAANNLVGKLANVHPDMSDQTVQTMQMFKKLTGRDTVSANVKFEEPIRFENYATLMFACNRMPVLKDDTRGNWRRWILIDFPNTFEPGAEGTEPKQVIMDRVTADAELQGLLVKCVEEIKAWDQGREWFPTAPSWEEARKRIRRAAEPVYDFAHACLEDAEGFETTDDVRRAYQNYASAEGLPPMSREQFGKQLLSQTDYTIEKKQKRVEGQRNQVYEGVVFSSRGQQLARGEEVGQERDDKQDSLGGSQGRADRVYGLAKQHANGDGISHDMLVGVAVGQGMGPEQAEAAIEKARKQGHLMNPDDPEVYYPT